MFAVCREGSTITMSTAETGVAAFLPTHGPSPWHHEAKQQAHRPTLNEHSPANCFLSAPLCTFSDALFFCHKGLICFAGVYQTTLQFLIARTCNPCGITHQQLQTLERADQAASDHIMNA